MTPPPSPLVVRDAVDQLKGVGPQRAAAYRSIGITTLLDLLRLPPRRYRDFPVPRAVEDLVPKVRTGLRGSIRRRRGPGRRRRGATRLLIEDTTGTVTALIFGPGYLAQSFRTGEIVLLDGELRDDREGDPVFLVRQYLHEDELPPPGEGARVPVYELPDAIAPRLHRRCVREAMARTRPDLAARSPRVGASEDRSISLEELFRWLHFPRPGEDLRAQEILGFEELIRLQEALLRLRSRRTRRTRAHYPAVDETYRVYTSVLPFAPTGDQRRSMREIADDLQSGHAMSRLLSGDVGSGKTAVAVFPLIVAARSGRQGALLAPTEILARQHCRTLTPLLEQLGLPPPVLVTGARGRSRSALDAPILVGTHRLFTRATAFHDLSVVVVDEQHKFGVKQRFQLWNKGRRPDVLLASATPIPRTLALTLFGHLDHSVLSDRPFVRRVDTQLLLGKERRELIHHVREERSRGGKVIVVCPALGRGTAKSKLPAATELAPWLQEQLGSQEQVGLLHGQLSSEDKATAVADFAEGDVGILVATIVVEVGIDVPNATMAVIVGADRFGLAQLHQIRGRVGRRGEAARCLLVAAEPGDEARERLQAFAKTEDGFRLAEQDLSQRGPGDLLGMRQTGMFRTIYYQPWADLGRLERARALAVARLRGHKPVPRKEFRSDRVASESWIW